MDTIIKTMDEMLGYIEPFDYMPPRHEPANIELEDKMINLAYLFNKAKNKYYRTLELDWYTEHDREIAFKALQRVQRWCCKTAIELHEKYHSFNI